MMDPVTKRQNLFVHDDVDDGIRDVIEEVVNEGQEMVNERKEVGNEVQDVNEEVAGHEEEMQQTGEEIGIKTQEADIEIQDYVNEEVTRHEKSLQQKEITEPVTKSLKLSAGTDSRLAEDMISYLPPDLIGNILSFLPTKEALATSVLSTKWKSFWTFISRLKFYDYSKKHSALDKANFISYVYRVVFSRKPMPLNYFGISCHQRYCASHFRTWLYVVLEAGVKELDLSIRLTKGDRRVLPSILFSSKLLVKLKLGSGFQLDVPPVVCLPNLEVLILESIIFPGDGSLRKLLNGCPVLKEFESTPQQMHDGYGSVIISLPLELFFFTTLVKLKIDGGFLMDVPTLVSLPNLEDLHLCDVKYIDNDALRRLFVGCPLLRKLNVTTTYAETVLHIDVPKLSKLTIFFRSSAPDSKVVLVTPSLQYLTVNRIAAKNLEVTELSQLVEANITDYIVEVSWQFHVASTLIVAISRVQTLHLVGDIMEVIVRHGYKLPMFHNLTTLKLGVNNRIGWELLPELLEKTPLLETLIFQNGLKDAAWFAPQRVPYCLIHHLKVIQVNYFRGHIEEEEVIKYFIENRGVTNDLIIQHSSGSGEIWDTVAAE